MVLNIVRDTSYKDKVQAMSIHGKYPYKLYLEVKGNSNVGRYIVVIANSQINKSELVDSISIKLNSDKRKARNVNTAVVKPNTTTDGYFITYKVKEVSILDVGDTPILVYRSTKENVGGLK